MLFSIPRRALTLISESAHLIWTLRCAWRIGKNGDPAKIPSENEITQRWVWAINKRLRLDRILTNKRSYGKKALNVFIVESTWTLVLDETSTRTLPPDWVSDMGDLVGVGRQRRRPGRNR